MELILFDYVTGMVYRKPVGDINWRYNTYTLIKNKIADIYWKRVPFFNLPHEDNLLKFSIRNVYYDRIRHGIVIKFTSGTYQWMYISQTQSYEFQSVRIYYKHYLQSIQKIPIYFRKSIQNQSKQFQLDNVDYKWTPWNSKKLW